MFQGIHQSTGKSKYNYSGKSFDFRMPKTTLNLQCTEGLNNAWTEGPSGKQVNVFIALLLACQHSNTTDALPCHIHLPVFL